MSKKKAKWLEESTNQELLAEVMEKLLLGDDIEKKDITRATKAIEELMERLPEEGEDLSLEEALAQLESNFAEGIAKAKAAYESELDAIDEDDEESDDEDDEEDLDEDEEDEDYSDWTVKELRAECRERGIATKGLKKDDMVEALKESDNYDGDEDDEEYDEDYEDEDDEGIDYDELSVRALKELMRDRGLKVRKGMKKPDLIEALEADDEE